MDASIPRGQPHRHFRCKCVLLYWTGDYPAQAKVSGTHDKTCHWCVHKSTHAPEVNRRCWGSYRQFLPDGHHFRDAGPFGEVESRPIPRPRNHDGFVADAEANVNHTGYKKDAPYKHTGVKELSPLRHLPLFDLVWDVTGDMMHIIPGK